MRCCAQEGSSAHIALRRAVSLVIAWALAFSSISLSFAEQGTLSPGSGESGQPVEDPAPKVANVVIVLRNTNTDLGSALNPNHTVKEITAKGGTLELDSLMYWTTGDESRNHPSVEWFTSDPSIATVYGGVVSAKKNGTVYVCARVSANTDGGQPITASAQIEVKGQDDARYVTALRIISPDGRDVTNENYEWEESYSTAKAQFNAEIDVFDPSSGSSTTYSTVQGSLSSQAPDLGDLSWSLTDASLGAVDPTTGLFRPRSSTVVGLQVLSLAGFSGSVVSAVTSVRCKEPGEIQRNGFNPQETFTIKAYYEEHPYDVYGDEALAVDKTYSLAEMEGLATMRATYTAFNSSDYYTMTGRGVPLESLLVNAGIKPSDIKTFAFGTGDWPVGENRPVTADFVLGTRYYYPNIDLGSDVRFSGAIPVEPMIAVESNERKGGSTDPDSKIDIGTRFRLLFGSTPAGGSTSYQIKWINTLYVVLKGAPPSEPGKGPGIGGGSQNPGGETSGSGSPDGRSGSDLGSGVRGIGGSSSLTTVESAGGDELAKQAAEGSFDAQGDVAGSAAPQGGSVSRVYQVSLEDADASTVSDVVAAHPLRAWIAPSASLFLVIGCTRMGWWYRRQTPRFRARAV